MSPVGWCGAARERRLVWKGFAFRLCLLSATLLLLLLGLQLGRRGSWDAQPAATERKGPRVPPDGRRADGTHGAPGRRQVTYVRSGRRASGAEATCCRQGAPPRTVGRKTIRWHIGLQPWASPTPSLRNEVLRLLKYISTVQISCDHMDMKDLIGSPDSPIKPWSICLDDRFSLVHQIKSKECRLYSLGLGSEDNEFEVSMANSGCEVHRFDPSIKAAHIQEGKHLWYHRVSIDWRDPNPMLAAHKLRINTKKLGTILHDFGHHKEKLFHRYWNVDLDLNRGETMTEESADNVLKCNYAFQTYCPIWNQNMINKLQTLAHLREAMNRDCTSLILLYKHLIDILKADMESAEWKILENLILEDIVEEIGQLVFEIHVHWPGFEVSGNESTVVRYWYSLLKELELKDFRLFHTYRDLSKPQLFLKRDEFNASSCYRLSWVNTRWKSKA